MNAEICLYGTSTVGAGWLARGRDGRLFGDGEPKQGRSFTEAVWLACQELEAAGYKGTVRVFAAGGKLMAETKINRPCYFGDLKWTAATVYTISAEAIEAATV